MSNSCKVFPEVFNKEGELVPSQLFQDLLKSGLDREQAKEKYLETRTLSFMEDNGHWLLYRDLNLGKVSTANLYTTDTAAQDAYNKFVEIYGKDYVEEPVLMNTFPAQYLIKVKEIARGDIKVNLNELGEPNVQFQKALPPEEKIFKQTVGIKKLEGSADYRASVNTAVDRYNKKYKTAHYVNWSKLGESTMFKIEGINYRWNGYNPTQGTMFQEGTQPTEGDNVLQTILDNLTEVTGIESSLITEAEAAELLGDSYNGEAAFFHGNKVYLVKGKASLESAFHEFTHPIINQIYLTDNALFNRLYAELENSEEGRAIIAEVEALYPELGIEAKRKEAITHALGKLSKDAYKSSREAQSLLTKILNAIKQFLNRAFGKKIDVNKLSANMTLAEFSKMLGNPVKQIKLDTGLSASNDLQFQKITDIPKLKKIVEESAVVIAKQVAIYSSRLKQGEQSRALDDLRETLDKIKAVEEVSDYFEAMEKALGTIKSSQKALESVAAKNGKFDRTDAMKLKSVEEQLESMAFIADLDQLLQTKDYYKIDLKDEDPFIKLVSDSITQRNHLLSLYRELSLDYLADLLFSQISPTNLEEVKQRKAEMLKVNPADSRALILITSKEDMRNHLEQAPRDIKILNKWLYSTAASNDAALALGALYVKEQLEKAADDTYIAARRMNAALQLYRARKNKLDIDKPREFNEAITETVMDIVYEFDEALGESVPKLHATMTLVNEFDMTKFNMSYLDMKARQKANPAKKKEIYREWVMANVELKDGHELIRDSKQRTLSPEAYREWYKDNYFSATKPKFGSEVYQPRRDKYQNAKYFAMDEADREYYDTLKDVLQEHQGKLPESHKQKLKLANWQDATVIPTRYKTLRERALDKDYKGAGKDFLESWVTINEEREQKYGLVKLDGEPFFGIPLHHIQRMDINDVSPDIFTNILYFADSVNKRQSLQSSEAEMLLLKDVLQSRDVARVTTKGTVIYDNLVESMRRKGFDVPRKIEPTKGGASAEKFSEFIDMIYYGRTELPAGNWLFGKLSINQTVNKLIGAASLTQLAFNVPAGVANKMTGEIMNFSASIGGRFYSQKDYAKAKWIYTTKFMPSVLKDMGKPMPESAEGKLLVLLDPIQGDFKDIKGKKIAQSTFMREFRSDHLFMINNVGEHTMQVSTLLAMMNAKQVTNAKTGEVKSLLDVYKDVNMDTMEIVLEDGYSIDPKEITQLRNRVHRLNQKLHGNYSNTVDMTLLQRRWYGKLALMFRKFVVPGLQRRWDVEHYDYELDQFEAGIYVDAYQYMVNNLIGDLKAFASREASILDSFTTDAERNRYIRQRAGFYQTMFEAAMFITTIILGALAIDEDDDEKDSQAAYMAALFLRRVRGDVSFYFNPLEFLNMVKNPTVTSSYVTSIVKFALGLVTEWGEDAYYDRQVGPFEKGSSKSYARFLKILPVIRSYVNLQSPEEQLKFYNLLSL